MKGHKIRYLNGHVSFHPYCPRCFHFHLFQPPYFPTSHLHADWLFVPLIRLSTSLNCHQNSNPPLLSAVCPHWESSAGAPEAREAVPDFTSCFPSGRLGAVPGRHASHQLRPAVCYLQAWTRYSTHYYERLLSQDHPQLCQNYRSNQLLVCPIAKRVYFGY